MLSNSNVAAEGVVTC